MGGFRSMRSAIGLAAAGFCLSLAGGGEASAQQRVVPPCVAMPSIRDSGIDQLCNSNGSWGFEFRPIAGKIRDPQPPIQPDNQTVDQSGAGSPQAQTRLAAFYFVGLGTPKNVKEAVRLWGLAAAQGYAPAQFNLGVLYLRGEGVRRNGKTAIGYYQQAAAGGYDDAQSSLGFFYLHGVEVPQDYAQAIEWFLKAAAQGNQKAYRNLGVAYRVAPAPLTNLAESYRWSRKSADAGDPASQYATGIMLIRGEGPPANLVEGAKYLKMAAGQGNLDAVWMLGGLYGSPENRTVYNVDEATRWLKLAITSDPEKAYIQICSIHATSALAQKQLNVPALTKAMAWCAIAEKQALSAPPEEADTGVVDLTSPISRQAEAYSKAIGEVFAKRLGQTGLGPLLNAQNFAKKCRANGYEACGL